MALNTITSCGLGLLLAALLISGCQTDLQAPAWDAGGQDSASGEVGPDPSQDAGRDAGDDGGDVSPDPTVIPENPPADSVCHGEWCWMAPRPFGHSVDHLHPVGEEIYGVARVGSVRGYEPFVWGDDFKILETPQVDGSSLADMTTIADGWLAVRASEAPMANRSVHEFGPGRLRDSVEIPDGCATDIVGTSAQQFVVWLGINRRCIGRNDIAYDEGEVLDLEVDHGARFWPNGDVWGMGLDAPDELIENWNIQELGAGGPVVGPAPTSPCSSQGRWMAGAEKTLRWWTEERGTWRQNHKMRSVLRDFSCSQDQRVTAVSEDGRFYWRVGELEWEFGQLSETGLYSMVTRDGTTYIAGESGTLFTRSQEETRQLHTPFSPLNDASEEDFHAQRVKDVWVSHDGSDAWLLDHQKLYRKTQEGWVHVPVGTPADPAGGPKQLWGIDDPELLTRNGAVYRWNGAVWEGTAENVLSPDESVVAIDGHSPSKMWVAESRGLARYDGETWIDVAAPGSTLEAELQSRDAEISDIDAAPDGTLLLAVGDDVLRLSGTTGDTQLEKAAESPCSGVDRVFQSEEGPLYVGTESGCVASRTDGTWQTRDISPRQVREFEPRPGNSLPLVVTDTGALKAMPDGSYTEAFRGETVAASAVPGIDAVVLAHTQGLLIKHY